MRQSAGARTWIGCDTVTGEHFGRLVKSLEVEAFGMSTTTALYQLEVKLGLARGAFPPGSGWQLTMHIDPMERGIGGKHPSGKVRRVNTALRELRELGVAIGAHKQFGRVDVVAEHEQGALRLIEV